MTAHRTIRTIPLPQGTIQYLDEGRGSPIVFVHGLLIDNVLWQPLLPALTQRFRCIQPNWPLGSHSVAMHPDADLSVPGMAKLIADFIEALDLTDVTLVGNDTGGALTQMVCARFPERIGRMVLTTCDGYDIFPPPAFSYLKLMGYLPFMPWLAAQLLLRVPALRGLPITFGDLTDKPMSSALIEHCMTPMSRDAGVRHDVRKFLRTLSRRYTQDAAVTLATIDKPALLLWSTRCHHFPKRLAEQFERELPHAELHWIDSRGVFLSLEYPDLLARHIARFVASHATEMQPAQRLQSI